VQENMLWVAPVVRPCIEQNRPPYRRRISPRERVWAELEAHDLGQGAFSGFELEALPGADLARNNETLRFDT
jgi:hypothetical protein